MVSSTPSSFFRSLINIPLASSLAHLFSDQYTAAPFHFVSSLVKACQNLTSLFSVKVRRDLMLLIFRKVNKAQLSLTTNLYYGQSVWRLPLENNKTNPLKMKER